VLNTVATLDKLSEKKGREGGRATFPAGQVSTGRKNGDARLDEGGGKIQILPEGGTSTYSVSRDGTAGTPRRNQKSISPMRLKEWERGSCTTAEPNVPGKKDRVLDSFQEWKYWQDGKSENRLKMKEQGAEAARGIWGIGSPGEKHRKQLSRNCGGGDKGILKNEWRSAGSSTGHLDHRKIGTEIKR